MIPVLSLAKCSHVSYLAGVLLVVGASSSAGAAPVGQFTGPTDVGTVNRPTVASFDAAGGTYTISASGENMWTDHDDFGFVWSQRNGDAVLAADITLVGTSAQGHRKAALMFRQTLDANSVYADVAVHGDGLTSLQFRSETGGTTREIQSPVRSPQRVRLEKRGPYVMLSLVGPDGRLAPSGCTIRLPLADPFYVGLAVCAHDPAAVETARFSRVELGAPEPREADAARTSAIEIIPLTSLDRRVVYRSSDHLESPHFSHDGSALFFNSNGRIHRLDLAGNASPTEVDTGFATKCNNDHGLSPDGTTLVFGDLSETGQGQIYLVPVAGGRPMRVNVAPPAYWHGWSPDGRTLAFGAGRGGNYDVYTIPLAGGAETRLTDAPGNDNGPDYSADGTWIYFHSNRSGTFQIWRMHTDGSNQEQVTDDDYANWFPHPAPDGKSIVFLSTKTLPETGHPPDGDYLLRQMPVDGAAPGTGPLLWRQWIIECAVLVARRRPTRLRHLRSSAVGSPARHLFTADVRTLFFRLVARRGSAATPPCCPRPLMSLRPPRLPNLPNVPHSHGLSCVRDLPASCC